VKNDIVREAPAIGVKMRVTLEGEFLSGAASLMRTIPNTGKRK